MRSPSPANTTIAIPRITGPNFDYAGEPGKYSLKGKSGVAE